MFEKNWDKNFLAPYKAKSRFVIETAFFKFIEALLLYCCNQVFEGFRIVHSQVCKHLAIQLDSFQL